jgi:hypothetical protein
MDATSGRFSLVDTDCEERRSNTLLTDSDAVIANLLAEEEELFAAALRRAVDNALAGCQPALWRRPEAAKVTDVSADLQRLRVLLDRFGLEEGTVQGDGAPQSLHRSSVVSAPRCAAGACQFRALSDQLYRSEKHHADVRAAVVAQLSRRPDAYAGFADAPWDEYLRRLAQPGEWGDHLTLQAAADAYGVRVCVLTTYAESPFLAVQPEQQRSERCLYLTLHAEVHCKRLR